MKREDSCSEKVRYPTRALAAEAKVGLAERGKSLRSYHCPACGEYHLASAE